MLRPGERHANRSCGAGGRRASSPPSSVLALVPAGAQQKAKADDVGITDKEIRIAVIADVDNPVVPGLFKSGADAVKAWGDDGQPGRRHRRPQGRRRLHRLEAERRTRRATRVIKACSEDFALVGTEALSLNNVADIEACPNAQGQPVGIPEFPGLVSAAEKCSPVVYYVTADAKYCETKDSPTVTYTTQQGDYRYYVSKNKDLHGIWLAPADVKSVKDAAVPSYQAGMDLGIKEDGEGIYDVFARDPAELADAVHQHRQGERFDLRLQRLQRQQDGAGPPGGGHPGGRLGEGLGLSPGLLRPGVPRHGGRRRRRHQLDPQHAALLHRVQGEPIVEELRQAGRRGREPQQLRHVGVGRGAPLPGRGREGRRQRRHTHPAVVARRAEGPAQIRCPGHHGPGRHRRPHPADVHRRRTGQEREVGAGPPDQAEHVRLQQAEPHRDHGGPERPDPQLVQTDNWETPMVMQFEKPAAGSWTQAYPDLGTGLDLVRGFDLAGVLRARAGGDLPPDVAEHRAGGTGPEEGELLHQGARGLRHVDRRRARPGRHDPCLPQHVSPPWQQAGVAGLPERGGVGHLSAVHVQVPRVAVRARR